MSYGTDALNRILESLKNPTPEQVAERSAYLRKHLNKAGIMTEELLTDVLAFVVVESYASYERLSYTPKEIDHNQFIEVFTYLDELLTNKLDTSEHFFTQEASFTYKEHTFIWCLMHGQGASCSIRTTNTSELAELNLLDSLVILEPVDSKIRYRLNPDLVDDQGNRI